MTTSITIRKRHVNCIKLWLDVVVRAKSIKYTLAAVVSAKVINATSMSNPNPAFFPGLGLYKDTEIMNPIRKLVAQSNATGARNKVGSAGWFREISSGDGTSRLKMGFQVRY